MKFLGCRQCGVSRVFSGRRGYLLPRPRKIEKAQHLLSVI